MGYVIDSLSIRDQTSNACYLRDNNTVKSMCCHLYTN